MLAKWIRYTGLVWAVLCALSSHVGLASEDSLSPQQQAAKLIARFSQENGCAPEVSLSRALCQVVCCPCCVPCLLLNICSETFTCPSTRRARLYERARVALGQWKEQAEDEGENTRDAYNNYLTQHRQTRSPNGRQLFENDTDFAAFYSRPRIQTSDLNTTQSIHKDPPPAYKP